MRPWIRIVGVALLVLSCAAPQLFAQETKPAEPEQFIVSLYRIAPDQHKEFIQWMGRLDMMSQEVGIPPTKVFVHDEGDAWDYLFIRAVPTPEQQEKLDEMSKQRGLHSGIEQHFQVRKYILHHTDTYVWGPMRLAELDKIAERGGIFR
jgi:hypothetical protein